MIFTIKSGCFPEEH